MKASIPKSVLLEGLQKVQDVVPARSTNPILNNVLVQAESGSMTLTTSNIDMSIRCKFAAEVQDGGTTTLPARRLASIVREMPDGEIRLETDGKHVTTVTCEAVYFKIMGSGPEEFPEFTLPESKHSFQLPQSQFRQMLRLTSYAVSMEESRYVLNGLLVGLRKEKMTVVATDGRRLALAEAELDIPKTDELDIIVPEKAANQLILTLQDEGTLKLNVSEKQIALEFGSTVFCSKLVEGTYPNFKQVIPAQCEERIAVEREALITVVRRMGLVTTDRSSAITLAFGRNRLVVSASTPELGEAKESIPIKYSGKEIAISFNPVFLLDPLKYLTCDEVFLELTDELSPGVLKADTPFLYVIMPIRMK